MKIISPRIVVVISAMSGAILLSACATRSYAPALYDFGPLPVMSGSASSNAVVDARRLPPIRVADVNAPAWLDGPLMFYRLAYANVQQPHPYATSRWSMTPAQLLGQRLKSRIVQAGGTVLSATDGVANTPLLRVEADEFIQLFGNAEQSNAQVALRASVFNGAALIGQKLFTQHVSAASADAAGGAKAIASASDAAIDDIELQRADMHLSPGR